MKRWCEDYSRRGETDNRKEKPRRSGVSFPREAMFAPLAAGLAQVGFRPTPADLVTVDGLRASKGAWGHIGLAPCAWNLTCSLG